jgi:D-alanyl-D-alanine carboxypeptidase
MMTKWIVFLFSLAAVTSCGNAGASLPPPAAAQPVQDTPVSMVIDTPPPSPEPQTPVPQIPLSYLMGNVRPAQDTLFRAIPQEWTSKSGIYMHREAWEAYAHMREAARKENVILTIVSAFRSFSDQKSIWENKWNGNTLVSGKNLSLTHKEPRARALEILKYSSMPGTSRHHWGTDLDLNSLNNDYFREGVGKKVYDWLTLHAGEFGFCQVYSPLGTDRPGGYNEERWHWSYLPVSSKYLEAYPATAGYENLKGFAGWETAEQIQVIEVYVQGINPSCKP